MLPHLPICAAAKAFDHLARQADALESTDALLQGALAIAMHGQADDPGGLSPAQVEDQLMQYAQCIRQRVQGSQPQAVIAHLHDYLFDELQLTGDTQTYYSPANSYLPHVLKTKHGLPISLALIYKVVAEQVGIACWGVALPGHFLAGIDFDGAPMLIDPFASGRMLTPDEARDRVQTMFGAEVEWNDELLQPASVRHWLTRMLQNLLNIFGSEGRYHDVAAMLEMEMLLWPQQYRLQRDLALVLARLGMSRPASIWLERYLSNQPDDPQEKDLKQLLDVLAA